MANVPGNYLISYSQLILHTSISDA